MPAYPIHYWYQLDLMSIWSTWKPLQFCRQIAHHLHEGEIPSMQNNIICNVDRHNYYNHVTQLCPQHPSNHSRPPRMIGMHHPWILCNARNTIPTRTKPSWNKPTDLSTEHINLHECKLHICNELTTTSTTPSQRHMERTVYYLHKYGETHSHHSVMSSIWFQQTASLTKLIAMARCLTNPRNRLTKNDKQIKNNIHGALDTLSQKQDDSSTTKQSHALQKSEPASNLSSYPPWSGWCTLHSSILSIHQFIHQSHVQISFGTRLCTSTATTNVVEA